MSRLPLTLLASLRLGKPSPSHVNGDIALVLILSFPQRSWDTRLAWEKGLGDEGASASHDLCALCSTTFYARLYTSRLTPCSAFAASDARKAMLFARSSGVTHLLKSALGIASRLGGVSIVLGKTPFTLMPLSRTSADRLSMMRCAAALLAVYAP